MRKYLILLLCPALLLSSCSSDEMEPVGYGQIALQLETEELLVDTKNTQTEEDKLSSYLLTITQGEETVMNQQKVSSVVVNGVIGMKAGDNYLLEVQSCTEADAESLNENWGQPRFAGESSLFSIKNREMTILSVACKMSNAKVSLSYDASFSYSYTDYSVEIYETSNPERKLTFNQDASNIGPFAYFNIDADPELTYVVKGRMNGGEEKTLHTGTVTLAASDWVQLRCFADPSGKVVMQEDLVDNTVTDNEENIDVSPY